MTKYPPFRLDEEDEGTESPDGFEVQLRELNMLRSHFIYHKTQEDPEMVEDYLNEFPFQLESLRGNTLLGETLTMFIDEDPIVGIRAFVKLMEATGKIPATIKMMKKLFMEESENPDWDAAMAHPDGSDNLSMYTSRIRAAYLFYLRGHENGLKSRFLLALTKILAKRYAPVPGSIHEKLHPHDKKELADYRCRLHAGQAEGMILESSNFLSLEVQQRIIAIMAAGSAGTDRSNFRQSSDTSSDSPQNDNDLRELLSLYPDPSEILEIILHPTERN